VLVSFLEEHLYNGVDGVEGEIYPAAMVMGTSALGMLVLQRLKGLKKVSRLPCWLGQSMYAAKLSMLVLPQVSNPPHPTPPHPTPPHPTPPHPYLFPNLCPFHL
jgi:hypothetical protein